jgi:hypothetical protein
MLICVIVFSLWWLRVILARAHHANRSRYHNRQFANGVQFLGCIRATSFAFPLTLAIVLVFWLCRIWSKIFPNRDLCQRIGLQTLRCTFCILLFAFVPLCFPCVVGCALDQATRQMRTPLPSLRAENLALFVFAQTLEAMLGFDWDAFGWSS